jgi:hypothetical protein
MTTPSRLLISPLLLLSPALTWASAGVGERLDLTAHWVGFAALAIRLRTGDGGGIHSSTQVQNLTMPPKWPAELLSERNVFEALRSWLMCASCSG